MNPGFRPVLESPRAVETRARLEIRFEIERGRLGFDQREEHLEQASAETASLERRLDAKNREVPVVEERPKLTESLTHTPPPIHCPRTLVYKTPNLSVERGAR